jgi:hypothetical protein
MSHEGTLVQDSGLTADKIQTTSYLLPGAESSVHL